MTEIKPCFAFVGATPEEQVAKITEEIGEVFEKKVQDGEGE